MFSIQSRLQPPQYYAHPSLTRYFDHIQSCTPVRASADTLTPAFNLIAFDLENAPKVEQKADPPKKKEKKAVEAEKAVAVEKAPQEDTPAPAASQKKEKKKEKKNDVVEESGKKKAAKAVPADDGDPKPSMIDLRVGHIVDGEYKCQWFDGFTESKS